MTKRRPPKAPPSRGVLVEARERQNKNQTAIAERFGISQAAVSYWETGEKTPHPSIWHDVADEYGISFSKVCEIFGAKAAS